MKMKMIKTKCIICGIEDKAGIRFDNIQGEPFFCERCLLIRLISNKPDLAHENIWKEEI